MKKVILATFLLLAGCSTHVDFLADGGNKEAGIVSASYTINPYLTTNATVYDGVPVAARACRNWGFKSAQPFGSVTKTCAHPTAGQCAEIKVTAEYQCVK